MKGLFLFSIFTIIYGSLFPFEFKYINWLPEGRDMLFSTSFFIGRTADLIGNMILFIPFGFAGSELLSRRKKRKEYLIYLYIFGFTLALSLQVIQVYLPSRVPALYDAVWNLLGIFIGILAAKLMRSYYPALLKADDRLALFILILCWIMFLLAPFFFTYDTGEMIKNIQIHLDPDQYRAANIFMFVAIWMSYASILKELFPHRKNVILSLEFAVVFTTIFKIFNYQNIIEAELLLSGIIAIILMRSGIFKKIKPYMITAIILLLSMYYNSLYPFEFFHNPYKEFAWIPFSELFSDNMLPKIRTVFYKTFIYGSIIWNLYKAFPNTRYIGYFCILYAGSIEYFQHLTYFRVGGFTEPLMVIFLLTFIKQKNEKFNLYEENNKEFIR